MVTQTGLQTRAWSNVLLACNIPTRETENKHLEATLAVSQNNFMLSESVIQCWVCIFSDSSKIFLLYSTKVSVYDILGEKNWSSNKDDNWPMAFQDNHPSSNPQVSMNSVSSALDLPLDGPAPGGCALLSCYPQASNSKISWVLGTQMTFYFWIK